MILTNALLSIGFSLVAEFTNIVSVPADQVPTRVEDLARCVVGDPHSPIDFGFLHRNGASFTVTDGVVDRFTAPGSFMALRDPDLDPRFFGKAIMTSSQVLELATKTVERLARITNPIGNIKAVVKTGQRMDGKEIPCYEITWPKPYYRPGFGYFAGVEIDARNGQITHLELHDPAFCNYALCEQISNRVYLPDLLPNSNGANTAGPRLHRRVFHAPLRMMCSEPSPLGFGYARV